MTEPLSPYSASTYDRRSEVEAILLADDTLLGRVYRHDLSGLTPTEIATEEGNENVGFVYNYRTQLRALLDEEVPNSSNISLQASRRVRKWLRTKALSRS